MELIVVSIGALSKNPLWNERVAVRSSHATTTLIRTTAAGRGGAPVELLVDPSLPGAVLEARLHERAGIKAEAITHVFLTNWRPVHRRGLEHFGQAVWWMHEPEIAAAGESLLAAEERAAHQGVAIDELVVKERALLSRVRLAPDALAAGVDLYPLPGYSVGQCGLLISEPARTTLVAGDAVPTAGHFAAGRVFPDCWDLAQAKESLLEVYEVADLIVPGHDNVFVSPRGASM